MHYKLKKQAPASYLAELFECGLRTPAFLTTEQSADIVWTVNPF